MQNGKKSYVFLVFLLGASLCMLVNPVFADTAPQRIHSTSLRPGDIDILKDVKSGDWNDAALKYPDVQDPLIRKIYIWLSLRKNTKAHDFNDYANFIIQNPDWPSMGHLKRLAEQSLKAEQGADSIASWFEENKPRTDHGVELYVNALIDLDRNVEVREFAQNWWADASLSPSQQKEFLRKYGRYLDTESHGRRLDYLLLNKHYTNARNLLDLLGSNYKKLAEARIALAEDKNDAEKRAKEVPPRLQDDLGLVYERIRWNRRQDRDLAAIQLLHHASFIRDRMKEDHVLNNDDWWRERHILIRRLIENKNFQSAYLLASSHHQKEGLSFAQAEFLAGWLSLRFLDEPWKAFVHFETLYKNVNSPISKSRASYWAGRASDALDHRDVANAWYKAAARHQTAFYGQLAFDKLSSGQQIEQQKPAEPSLNARATFEEHELVRVAKLLQKAGYRSEVTTVLDGLTNMIKSPDEYMLLADLSRDLDHYHNAIRISKKGLQQDIFLMEHAYPTMLSEMRNIRTEWALIHGLIRQESAFNYDARSHAGASGLMQLMPATAAEVARKNGLKHRHDWLTTSPSHNIKLGTLYLQQMLDRYDGSYAMALAAYNGGPGRVDRWIRQNGDPRKGEIDLIDWMEMIPVYETRNYVQRVMESLYVYRIKFDGLQKNVDIPLQVAYQGQ